MKIGPALACAFFGTVMIGTAPAEPPELEAMKKVSFLVGEWKGGGWMEFVPGRRGEFQGTESVESRLGGLVLIIEGKHWDGDPGGADARVVHHALAVLSYDGEEERYRFRTYLADGRGAQAVGRIEGDAFQWSMKNPRGQMRYTIRLNEKGEWHEIGEMSRDGTNWRHFFEMRLQRVSASESDPIRGPMGS